MVTIFKGIESYTNFLWNWIGSGRLLVDQSKADSRAATCASCHNNVPIDQAVKVGCCGNGINSVLKSFRIRIIQNRTTPSDGQLQSCGLCGCDLKMKVWLPIEASGLSKEDSNAFPDFCFQKKELENL